MKPLKGETRLPGDKSISHRALMIASLAKGTSRLRGVSAAADPLSTMACLGNLGVQISSNDAETVVTGAAQGILRAPTKMLDCGNSGTTMRLLSGILAGQPFGAELSGDASLRRRPMERVAEPLRRMGAVVETAPEGRPPVRITGLRPLHPISFEPNVPSAQVKSAVLFAGLFADGETSVVEATPTRDHTERLLGLASSQTDRGIRTVVRGGSEVAPLDMQIPGDCSASVFLIGATAIVTGSEILIRNVGVNPHRARVLDVLRRWGVVIKATGDRVCGGEPVADLIVRTGEAKGPLVIEASDVPALIDEIPALALTAMATGCSFRVTGASELRTKESDRIAVITAGLRSLGVVVDEWPDGFAFEETNNVLGATIRTEGDHRIAMAFAIASLRHPSIQLDDRSCVAVSFPDFFATLDRLHGRSH